MLKRIGVQQLQVGMYLEEFCSSWLEHPYWRSGFVITDASDIRRLCDSSVSEVWIDCHKGIDVAPNKVSVSASEAEALIDDELNRLALDERTAENVPENDEYVQAAAVCAQAKQLAIELFQEARMGKAINTVGAKLLVDQVLASVSRNNCAPTRLVRLKTMSEFT